MAAPVRLDPSLAPGQPWANGAGSTRELWVDPDRPDAPRWRVSMADLTADAPFSSFPGLDRLFLPVEGTLVLVVNGRTVPAPVGSPVRFAGEATVSVLVTGPGRALNLMVRRGDLHGDLVARRPGTEPVGHPAATAEVDGMIVDVHLSPADPMPPGATP